MQYSLPEKITVGTFRFWKSTAAIFTESWGAVVGEEIIGNPWVSPFGKYALGL